MKRIVVILVIAALGVAALLYLRGDDPPVFASMDDFLTSDYAHRDNHQVVFIGLDGATWDFIDAMIADGELPAFARLKGEGTYGRLRSVDCYFTPPAWTTMLTGYRPERTGIYTFGKWSGEGNAFQSVSSLDVEVPRVWDVASAAGRRVAVTNVPVTYPAHPVNGIMVGGIMAPLAYTTDQMLRAVILEPFDEPFHPLDKEARSPRLRGETTLQSNTIVFVLYDTSDDQRPNHDTVVMKVFAGEEGSGDRENVPAYVYKVEEPSPWFSLSYAKEGENPKPVTCSVTFRPRRGFANASFSPMIRLPSDPELKLTYPETLGQEIEDEFGYYLTSVSFDPAILPRVMEDTAGFARYFYNYDDWDLYLHVFMMPDVIMHHEGFSQRAREVFHSADRFLSELIEEMPDDVTLVLASDHGFKRYKYIINLNAHLEKWGLLENLKDVDFASTLVFHDRWCVYFNKKLLTAVELERRGIAVPDGGTPREALIAYLRGMVRTIENPFDKGRKMPIELIEVPGASAGTPPDLIVIGGYDDYYVVASDLKIRNPKLVVEAQPRSQWYHDRDGIYLFWGSHIRPGVDAGRRNIEDIAPTMLYLLGLPLATDFDGQVMRDIIKPDIASSKKAAYVDGYEAMKPDVDLSHEELQSLEEKLKTLGYIR